MAMIIVYYLKHELNKFRMSVVPCNWKYPFEVIGALRPFYNMIKYNLLDVSTF